MGQLVINSRFCSFSLLLSLMFSSLSLSTFFPPACYFSTFSTFLSSPLLISYTSYLDSLHFSSYSFPNLSFPAPSFLLPSLSTLSLCLIPSLPPFSFWSPSLSPPSLPPPSCYLLSQHFFMSLSFPTPDFLLLSF